MNALGLALVLCAARTTILTATGTIVYLLCRRSSPTTRARVALASLITLSGLFVLELTPWPRWWSVDPTQWLPRARVAAESARIQPHSLPAPSRRVEPTIALPKRAAAAVPLAKTARTPLPARISHAERPPRRLVSHELAERSQARPSIAYEPQFRSPNAPRVFEWHWPEALALTFLVGVALGLTRLLMGLWAVRRMRISSVSIVDPNLHETLGELCAQMGLRQTVALRVSANLTTPATTGWRRPWLFLPADWKQWTDDERRVVLAHELAHIARGDYLAWMLAQLSLVFHFYHPLAHWLLRRLRLEQELAADDWGARHAGGRQIYLATLARMALRQDVRPAAWPVRSFFPVRGTFLRRIEMLRKKDEHGYSTSPWTARAMTFGILAGTGLLLAGLRGPLERAVAQEPKDAVAKPASALAGASRSMKSAPNALDLRFVPENAALIVAARPSALLHEPQIKTLFDVLLKEEQIRHIVDLLNVENVDQVSLVVSREAIGAAALNQEVMLRSAGVIVRSSVPRDWKATAAALVPGISFVDTKYAGQPYSSLTVEGASFGYFMADDRTIVIAAVPALFSFIKAAKDAKSVHPWTESWNAVADSQAAVALDVGSVRGLVEPLLLGPEALQLAPLTGMVSPLWEETTSLAFGLNVSHGLKFDLVATCGNDEGGEKVAQTLQAVVTLARNSSKSFKSALHRAPSSEKNGEAALLFMLTDLGEELLSASKVERNADVIHVHTKSKREDILKTASLLLGVF